MSGAVAGAGIVKPELGVRPGRAKNRRQARAWGPTGMREHARPESDGEHGLEPSPSPTPAAVQRVGRRARTRRPGGSRAGSGPTLPRGPGPRSWPDWLPGPVDTGRLPGPAETITRRAGYRAWRKRHAPAHPRTRWPPDLEPGYDPAKRRACAVGPRPGAGARPGAAPQAGPCRAGCPAARGLRQRVCVGGRRVPRPLSTPALPHLLPQPSCSRSPQPGRVWPLGKKIRPFGQRSAVPAMVARCEAW